MAAAVTVAVLSDVPVHSLKEGLVLGLKPSNPLCITPRKVVVHGDDMHPLRFRQAAPNLRSLACTSFLLRSLRSKPSPSETRNYLCSMDRDLAAEGIEECR